jgi:hypothetical protein
VLLVRGVDELLHLLALDGRQITALAIGLGPDLFELGDQRLCGLWHR